MTASEKRSAGGRAAGSATRGRAAKSGAKRSAKGGGKAPRGQGDGPDAADTSEEAPSFEVSLARLEAVVQHLESGDLELEEALGRFEEGVQLSKACAAQLDAAERRIELLVESSEGLSVRPFSGSGDANDDADDTEEAEEEDDEWT